MNWDDDEFWALVPERALHPCRGAILEAFRWIGEPLSPVDLVDLFDGVNITMWEADHHLQALASLGVVEPDPESRNPAAPSDVFHLPYRLTLGEAHA